MKHYDIICVGGGIMSTTLATLIQLIDSSVRVAIFERLDDVAKESSSAWNNAGTGHSALCELNYTPLEDNQVNISKAIKVFEQFEISKQFWSFLVTNNLIKDPSSFIQKVPHHSWVHGEDNVSFLEKRFEALSKHPFFAAMQFTKEHNKMQEWFPLIMKDRASDEAMAGTRVETGAEMNFGALAHEYKNILEGFENVDFYFEHEVVDVDPTGSDDDWLMIAKCLKTGDKKYYNADNVFIGAGGWALPLLQKVEIPERDGYGGFPVSGQWLVCKNKEIIEQHNAKVYTKAGVNAPPMSVPHLDTRYVNGEKQLMFGPFAGFSTKFLKEGSYLDLPKSINFENINPMLGAFWKNLPLTKYLIEQVTKSHSDRMKDLRQFMVNADADDWELKVAGQRVQIIKKDDKGGGNLQFGTEVVKSKDGNITTLLGASPGASVAVDVMLEVLQIAFPEKLDAWSEKLSEVVPFWNKKAENNEQEFLAIKQKNDQLLNLD